MGWFDDGANDYFSNFARTAEGTNDPLLLQIEEAEKAQQRQRDAAAQAAQQQAQRAALAQRAAQAGVSMGGGTAAPPSMMNMMNTPSAPDPMDWREHIKQTQSPEGGMNSLMRGAGLQPPVPDATTQTTTPQFREGQTTVQRDKQGNILGASNRLDASGMPVLASSNPNAGPAEVFQGGNVSNPGGQGEEMYRNYLRNSGGGRLNEYMAQEAAISRNTALANDPFAEENARLRQQIQLEDHRADSEVAKVTARDQATRDYTDSLIDPDTQEQLNTLRSLPAYQTATPEGRRIAEANIMAEARQRKLEAHLNPRGFTAG